MKFDLNITKIPKAVTLRFEIESTKPMMMNPYIPNDKEFAKQEQSGNISAKECAEHRIIRDEDGSIAIPNTYIERGMEQSATAFKLEGAGKKTYKDIIRGYTHVEPAFIKLLNTKITTDSRGVVIKATRGRIMRHRPRVETYKAIFDVVVADPKVSLQTTVNIVQYLGARIGIGDNRPKNGLFKVTSVKEVT